MAKTPVDKPTRLDVQRLLKDLFEKYRTWRSPAMESLNEEIEAVKKRILNNAKLKALEKRYDAMQAALRKRNVAGADATAKVNRLFQAQGLTPEVQRQVIALAKRFNAGK